jgi:hypothetical protein
MIMADGGMGAVAVARQCHVCNIGSTRQATPHSEKEEPKEGGENKGKKDQAEGSSALQPRGRISPEPRHEFTKGSEIGILEKLGLTWSNLEHGIGRGEFSRGRCVFV